MTSLPSIKPWLIVPVKPFDEGKSRLGDELAPLQRARLSRQLLEHVLATAMHSRLFAHILLVSRDGAAAEIAQAYSAQLLPENGRGLNQALEQARRLAQLEGAPAILVLPSDLPRLRHHDLVVLVDADDGAAGMVIAPSRDGGTNALLLRPPQLIPFAFGVGSFARHVDLARLVGVAPAVIRSPTLAFDLDRPADLAELRVG